MVAGDGLLGIWTMEEVPLVQVERDGRFGISFADEKPACNSSCISTDFAFTGDGQVKFGWCLGFPRAGPGVRWAQE